MKPLIYFIVASLLILLVIWSFESLNVSEGMTKKQVLETMKHSPDSISYNNSSQIWYYRNTGTWQGGSSNERMVIFFNGDKVDRVSH